MKTPHEADSEALLNTLRLLYVEDDTEALQELSHFLRKRVADLKVAANGAEALQWCLDQSFDAIVCDLWMPEMDGFALIERLRSVGIHTPVIITSAFSDSETILRAVDLGIVKYCVKPVDPEELLDSLCRIAIEHLTDAGELILPGNRLMDRQQRLESEKTLKSTYAYLLKTLTGKGPREIHVSLGTDCVEVSAAEVLTPLELSLLQIPGNESLVTFLRKTLYTGNQESFEARVSEAFQLPASLESVRIGLLENSDRLTFSFRRSEHYEVEKC